MRSAGCELSVTGDGRGEGLIAVRRFNPATVVVGEIERGLPGTHSNATQVGVGCWLLTGGLSQRSIIHVARNCGEFEHASVLLIGGSTNIEPGERITFDQA